jgi:hypothetical protein
MGGMDRVDVASIAPITTLMMKFYPWVWSFGCNWFSHNSNLKVRRLSFTSFFKDDV